MSRGRESDSRRGLATLIRAKAGTGNRESCVNRLVGNRLRTQISRPDSLALRNKRAAWPQGVGNRGSNFVDWEEDCDCNVSFSLIRNRYERFSNLNIHTVLRELAND